MLKLTRLSGREKSNLVMLLRSTKKPHAANDKATHYSRSARSSLFLRHIKEKNSSYFIRVRQPALRKLL